MYLISDFTTNRNCKKLGISKAWKKKSMKEICKKNQGEGGVLHIYRKKDRKLFFAIFYLYEDLLKSELNIVSEVISLNNTFQVITQLNIESFKKVPNLFFGFHFKNLYFQDSPGDSRICLSREQVFVESTLYWNTNKSNNYSYGLHLGKVCNHDMYRTYISDSEKTLELNKNKLRIGFMFPDSAIELNYKYRGKLRVLKEIDITKELQLFDGDLTTTLNYVLISFIYLKKYFNYFDVYEKNDDIIKLVSTKIISDSFFS
jgi:hypothetical protein